MTDMNFRTFDIRILKEDPAALYSLGNDAISKLAGYFHHELPDVPTVANLRELVGKVGSNKELQANVSRASQVLGRHGTTIAAEILEQSGILSPLNRSFTNMAHPVPSECNLVITGGVANWMLRRGSIASRINPIANPKAYVATGNRVMKSGEHQRVETLSMRLGHQPSEYDFASYFLVPDLARDGFDVKIMGVASGDGDTVFKGFLAVHRHLLDARVLIIGNAPSAWHTAGQFRIVARELNPDFDSDGKQLFVRSDKISLAQDGDQPADAQHPISGLGALARAAVFIMENVLN